MTPYILLFDVEKKIKLQKQKAYEYKGHPLFKYRLNIPSEMIRELGWDKDSIELSIHVKDTKLEISRA